jgi:hypothetical protein
MAASALRLLPLALALVPGACNRAPQQPSVTVKLPPARPAPARPAFTFNTTKPVEPRPKL